VSRHESHEHGRSSAWLFRIRRRSLTIVAMSQPVPHADTIIIAAAARRTTKIKSGT
jgi:hypothetical protein